MTHNYRFGVVLVLLLALDLLIGVASAQGTPYFYFTDLWGIGCDSQVTRVTYDGVNYDTNASYVTEGIVRTADDIYEHSIQTIPGSAFLTNWFWQAEDYNNGGGQTANFPLPPDTPFSIRVIAYTNPEQTEGWVAEVYLDQCNGGQIIDRVDYAYVAPVVTVDNTALFFDGRINNNDPAAPVIVFGHDFDDGRGLIMYSSDDRELLVVTPEQLANVPDCPAENTLIASNSAENIDLYRLTTCEYQVNAPTSAGKTYVLIFEALYPVGYESYEALIE